MRRTFRTVLWTARKRRKIHSPQEMTVESHYINTYKYTHRTVQTNTRVEFSTPKLASKVSSLIILAIGRRKNLICDTGKDCSTLRLETLICNQSLSTQCSYLVFQRKQENSLSLLVSKALRASLRASYPIRKSCRNAWYLPLMAKINKI